MTSREIHLRALEIDDQNRRMTGLVVGVGIGLLTIITIALICAL
jgi:hypothetical protein